MVFTGDLAGPDKDFPAVCFELECDAIVCEAAHFPVEAAAPVFEKCRTRRIYLNHIAPHRQDSIAAQRNTNPPYELIAVTDGYEAEI